LVRVFVNLGPPKESSFARPLALLSECHRRIERFLADMIRIASSRQGRALEEPDQAALAGAVNYFSIAAPRHTADEEESLFPRLRSARAGRAEQALEQIRRLEADHQQADSLHAEANALASRWISEGTLDAAAARRLNELLEALSAIYREHIAVEDAEVFPAARAALSAAQLEAVGREMAARRGLDFDQVVGQRPIEPHLS
jgi:hemerythrin-like domain-containing protein